MSARFDRNLQRPIINILSWDHDSVKWPRITVLVGWLTLHIFRRLWLMEIHSKTDTFVRWHWHWRLSSPELTRSIIFRRRVSPNIETWSTLIIRLFATLRHRRTFSITDANSAIRCVLRVYRIRSGYPLIYIILLETFRASVAIKQLGRSFFEEQHRGIFLNTNRRKKPSVWNILSTLYDLQITTSLLVCCTCW